MKWRWFQHRMHSLIEGTFPLSLINDPIYKSPIGNFSINFCTLRLCYRRWDVWVSRKWSGKIFSPLSDAVLGVTCGELSVSEILCGLVTGIGWWCGEGEHFFRIFLRILDDVKPNSLMGNWGLGENESLHLSRRNWLAGAHNSFRLHSLTVIRIYKIVFSGFLWQCASKTNHHLATHWAHLTRYCCFSYHHGVRGKQRNHNPINEAERVLHKPTQACF